MKTIDNWSVDTNVHDSSAPYRAPEGSYVRLHGRDHHGRRIMCGWIVAVARDCLGNPKAVETLSGSVYHLVRPDRPDGFQALDAAWDKLGGYSAETLAYLRRTS